MTQEILSTYKPFIDAVWPYVHIAEDKGYEAALELLEELLESSVDSINDPLNPLIDMLSNAIERYESADEQIKEFVDEAQEIPNDIALLKTLMEQYGLTGNDLPEIGSKSMVSKVLNGKRDLSRPAIEKLCARFNLKPAMFF